MTHGAHRQLYNVVQLHDPWRGCTVVQCCTTPSPMEGVSRCTTLYNPMTHGDLYPSYNIVWPHDPWGFVTIAAPMTHGKKVAEPCAIGYCANENSGELFSFPNVQPSWDLWSVGIIGPGCYRSFRHGLDVYGSRDFDEGRVGLRGEARQMKRASKFVGSE